MPPASEDQDSPRSPSGPLRQAIHYICVQRGDMLSERIDFLGELFGKCDGRFDFHTTKMLLDPTLRQAVEGCALPSTMNTAAGLQSEPLPGFLSECLADLTGTCTKVGELLQSVYKDGA